MYKTGILNSEISKVLSDLGHTDTIIIADCGLPVPDGVKNRFSINFWTSII